MLDLACGTGFYSRLVKSLGAAEVVGVDVSDA
ncbi:class I SAM-dependent methyltransferase [Sorangium sp. So ce1389]